MADQKRLSGIARLPDMPMINGEWTLTGSGIRGWANSDECSRPLWLEILADKEPLGLVCADLPEPGGSGFWFNVPDPILTDSCKLEVRVVNTDDFIAQRGQAKVEANGLTGQLVMDRGLTIRGWVCDYNRADHAIMVGVYVDDQKVAETVAAERRFEPPEADGHGFSLELPLALADGQPHIIEVRDDRNRPLPGSPIQIRSMPQNAASWLRTQKKLDKPMLEMLTGMLEIMEDRLPGVVSLAQYEHWKKAFPAEGPRNRRTVSYGLLPGTEAGIVPKQCASEFRCNESRAEFFIAAHPGTGFFTSALGLMYASLKNSGAALVYADSEDSSGLPQFKPAWDREAFLARDYLGPLIASADLVAKADLNSGDSPELARLKLVLAAGDNILHLPLVLSRTAAPDTAARTEAVAGWLAEFAPQAKIRPSGIAWPIERRPPVTIIIPTRDHADLLERCLDSLAQTDWPDYEILIVDNGSQESAALDLLQRAAEQQRVRVLVDRGEFNYARINNEAARQARGELICFLNNDTEALHPEWLTELARPLLTHADAGASGAQLVWPNGLVQHGGVIVGIHQLAAHVGNSWLADEPGYMDRNQIVQEYSAVTAACMLTNRALFLDSGGFDERRFPVAFNDVDYCLRLRSAGKKIYWTPESRLAHHESASRGKDTKPAARARSNREMNFFRKIWGHYDDPFYNPNLSLSTLCEPFHGLAFPPRAREARYAAVRS